MSVYFDYANHTLREIVSLADVDPRDAGAYTEGGAVANGGLLAYLMLPVAQAWQSGYRGRWGSQIVRGADGAIDFEQTMASAHRVAIVADSDVDREELAGYHDITVELVAEATSSRLWRRRADPAPRQALPCATAAYVDELKGRCAELERRCAAAEASALGDKERIAPLPGAGGIREAMYAEFEKQCIAALTQYRERIEDLEGKVSWMHRNFPVRDNR